MNFFDYILIESSYNIKEYIYEFIKYMLLIFVLFYMYENGFGIVIVLLK